VAQEEVPAISARTQRTDGRARLSISLGEAVAPCSFQRAAHCSRRPGGILGVPLPPDLTYRPLPTLPFFRVKAADEAQKAAVMQRQSGLLNERYDLSDRAMQNVMMSGGRKPVQQRVRVKLAAGVTWDALAAMSSDEIRQKGSLPPGFLPLPHVKHATGGQVFPDRQIDEIRRQGDLRRFDVNFDFPDHITAEFPPLIFLTTRPQLGDVSRGQLLTIRFL
jgi:hypothetical protein